MQWAGRFKADLQRISNNIFLHSLLSSSKLHMSLKIEIYYLLMTNI